MDLRDWIDKGVFNYDDYDLFMNDIRKSRNKNVLEEDLNLPLNSKRVKGLSLRSSFLIIGSEVIKASLPSYPKYFNAPR